MQVVRVAEARSSQRRRLVGARDPCLARAASSWIQLHWQMPTPCTNSIRTGEWTATTDLLHDFGFAFEVSFGTRRN